MKRSVKLIIALAIVVFTMIALAVTVSAECDHDFSMKVVVVEPTCTTAGEVRYLCSKCGEDEGITYYTKTIHELIEDGDGEEYEKIEGVAATCTAPGYKKVSCKVCGTEFSSETYAATGHYNSDLDWYLTDADARLEDCSRNVDYTAPTCTGNGKIAFKCDYCGVEIRSYVLDPVGHFGTALSDYLSSSNDPEDYFGEFGVDYVEPTCTASGRVAFKCDACGVTLRTFVLDPTGHYNDDFYWYLNDADATLEECSRNVDYKAPTCLEPGKITFKCDYCNKEMRSYVLDPTGHDDGVWRIDFEPTADHDGQMTRYCVGCGKALESKEFAMHTHVKGYAKIIKDATCTEEGERGVFCAKCGAVYDVEEIPALGHDDGVWKLDFETNYSYGYEGNLTRYCSKCGAALETKTQSKYAEIMRDTSMTSPAMGDSREVVNAALYIVISLSLFAAASGSAFIVRKKKSQN